jgi:hypothetical protein
MTSNTSHLFKLVRAWVMMHAKNDFSPAIVMAALLVAGNSRAADFRVLDFSSPCDSLPALEAAAGSTAFQDRLPSGFQFAFRAREMDRDAVIAYACRDGHLFRGAYIFPAKDEADATTLYGAVKRRVTSELGAPSYDFASKEYRQKMRAAGATLSRADTQVAFWNGKRSEAHASVAAPSGDQGWRVSLSYTAL